MSSENGGKEYMEKVDGHVEDYQEGEKTQEEMINDIKSLTREEQVEQLEKYKKKQKKKIAVYFAIFSFSLTLILLGLYFLVF